MKPQRHRQSIFLIVSSLLISGCSGQGASMSEAVTGVLKGSVYCNEYFGFELPIPTDWSVQDTAAQERISTIGRQAIAGEDRGLDSAIKAAAKSRSINLLMVFQHPLGAPVTFNPNLISNAELVADLPGIQSGKDYLFHVKKLAEAGSIRFEFAEETTSEILDGRKFDVMTGTMFLGSMVIHQKFYSAITGGYALNFILTGANKEEVVSLQKFLQGISFHD